ncbi:MAG TPA: agmatine deiminase family protein [Pseudomonadales bacterium]
MSKPYSMLPEWAPQQAVMLAWPHDGTDWAPWLEAIERDYVELAAAIATEVPPLVLCRDAAHREHVAALLQGRCMHAPLLVIASYNDTWCRDYGPVTVSHAGNMQLLDFQFHGWGAKYDAQLDNGINRSLIDLWQAPLVTIDYELEGGSIETDGCGTLLTTEHCLLDSNRNSTYSREGVEQFVLGQLGLDRIVWLSEGMLIGDDTDSHIDNLARFCDAHTIAYASCSVKDDPHHEPLGKMAAQLRALRKLDGSAYRLVPIELPVPQFDEEGARLPGSYVNFLVVNRSVIVPVFGCAQDAAALNALQDCFPGRHIVPVPGGNLIRQFGGPHCATMQLPVNTLKT